MAGQQHQQQQNHRQRILHSNRDDLDTNMPATEISMNVGGTNDMLNRGGGVHNDALQQHQHLPPKRRPRFSTSSSSASLSSSLIKWIVPLICAVLLLVTVRQGLGIQSSLSLESSLLSLDLEVAAANAAARQQQQQQHLDCSTTTTVADADNDVPQQQQQQQQLSPPPPPRNSSTATVMAMATGYRLDDYERFVGSLRKTGYSGHIILAVAPTMDAPTERYLLDQGVTLYKVQKMNCTYTLVDQKDVKTEHDQEIQTCLYPYPTLKHRWARYPLLRDLLLNCTTCTGPVLHTDLRDTLFQRDPFGPDAPPVTSLQVFEEHYTIRTTNWVSDWPVFACKNVHIDEPMLCSGTTVGTRTAMIEYLNVMHEEMNAWMADPKCCCFQTNADDQSMHNWVYYGTDLLRQRPGGGAIGGQPPKVLTPEQRQRQQRIRAVAVPNRQGIVNTVGAMGALVHHNHMRLKEKYLPKDQQVDMHSMPFDGAGIAYNGRDSAPKEWLGIHHGMTDEQGYFVQNDGTRSFVIHQIDRFGHPLYEWINKNREELLVTAK